jgi:hypothetical protein
MLERDRNPSVEGSGTMLFYTMKSLLVILPQSTCYRLLRDRLVSISRFRQSAMKDTSSLSGVVSNPRRNYSGSNTDTEAYVERVWQVRELHCGEAWTMIRSESLETPSLVPDEAPTFDDGAERRRWLGYASRSEELSAQKRYREQHVGQPGVRIEEFPTEYQSLHQVPERQGADVQSNGSPDTLKPEEFPVDGDDEKWKNFWEERVRLQ